MDFCSLVQAASGTGPAASPPGVADWLSSVPAATHHISFRSSEQSAGSGGIGGDGGAAGSAAPCGEASA